MTNVRNASEMQEERSWVIEMKRLNSLGSMNMLSFMAVRLLDELFYLQDIWPESVSRPLHAAAKINHSISRMFAV